MRSTPFLGLHRHDAFRPYFTNCNATNRCVYVQRVVCVNGGAILGVFGIQHITWLSKIDVESVKFEGRNERQRNKYEANASNNNQPY
jgi:hypothetical protein